MRRFPARQDIKSRPPPPFFADFDGRLLENPMHFIVLAGG
jgi:hypothetical protein